MPKSARFRDVFESSPDEVGQSEYRAIAEAIADALGASDAAGEPDMDARLDDGALDHAIGCLNEFRDWSEKLLARAREGPGGRRG